MPPYENRVDFENLLKRVEALGGIHIRIREEGDSILLKYELAGDQDFTFLISHPNPVRRQTLLFIYNTWQQDLDSYNLEV